ncbi:MAG TPA: twin-arginine translocase TatA/TatE family subunit [Bacillus sp. (in: firmicutes)]|uniref:twin-arginine translocase TatA/TatE family subunit n=1 Tax=Bacillus litorisediminis TaxID=2922713 RepID=UPI0028BE816A|nr:twin-arginine translocase TatA/TatE family subunit [Bacillus litorisediminis]HWO78279.1 twin-arginine translocase TatA/TatE family subunit [Bacillus sp. (in: firmicutes)]
MNIGFGEAIVILIVGLLIFGPSKLPSLGRAAGKTIHEFRRGMREIMEDSDTEKGKQ